MPRIASPNVILFLSLSLCVSVFLFPLLLENTKYLIHVDCDTCTVYILHKTV